MVNVEQNRRARKYSSNELVRRVLWTLAQPLFRFSPRPCFAWRRFLLRCFGATIGQLGPRVTISRRAHICAGTHDYTKPDFPLLRPPILIGAEAWICADAFVGRGVTIGEGAIVGARAVAMKDVQPWSIVIGNPAHETKRRGTTQ
jgi:putative colanic acid biosynthesis acetyltransferase WcaF